MDRETVTFTTKGRVVIPASVRRKFGIAKGSKAAVSATAAGILLRPITRDYIRGLRGSLKGQGVLKAMAQGRQNERGH